MILFALWSWALITLTAEIVFDFTGGSDPYSLD